MSIGLIIIVLLVIIAVTSLASDEDVDRGKQVGINDYHIKLDRERLMATVAERLRSAARTSSARDRQETAEIGRSQ